MNTSPRPFRSARSFPARRDRGSAFITAVMFMLIASLLIASIFEWSSAERRINIYNAYYLEARHAAEAVAEYGAYQVQNDFNSSANPPSLDPAGNTALTIPPSVYSFFSGPGPFGSQVANYAYDASHPYGMQVIGSFNASSTNAVNNGNVPTGGGLYYVNPNDPDNASDTLSGQYTTRRDVQILAKATVLPPVGAPVTAYVTETVSVRGSPLFANAIFYSNNDLEASPGPDFDIYGPVHVNGNIFVSAQGTVETGSANYVAFHGPVSITGNLYHAWASTTPSADGRGYSSSTSNMNGEPLGNDPVTFVNAAGTQVNLQGSQSTWDDSTMGGLSALLNGSGLYANTGTPALTQLTATLDSSDFRTYATQTWGGNLQTASMGVQSYNPVSYSQPIDSSGDLPDPHSIIDPPLPASLITGDYATALAAVETQKFSNQSGLYILVTVTPGTNGGADSATINLYGPSGTAGNATVTGPNGGALIATIPAGTATSGQIATFIPYQATSSGTTTTPVNSYSYSITTQSTGSGSTKTTSYYINTSTTSGTSSQPLTVSYNGTSSTPGLTNNGSATITTKGKATSSSGTTAYPSSAAAQAAINSLPTSSPTGSSTTTISTNNNVISGLYDPRQQAGVNLVQIDMSALKTALGNSGGNATLNQAIATNWNGGVYVDVETAGVNATADGTYSYASYPGQTSVITANSQVAKGSSMLPTVNNVSGLMLATNAPMYVLGNFNADGTISTSSSTNSAIYPDDGKTDAPGGATSAEVPSALAADSITILSSNYFGNTGTSGASVTKTSGSGGNATISYSNSSSSSAYASSGSSEPSASGNVEVAAAFITGIVTTNNSTYSGGVNNLPRFIENWGSNSVAIRGSLTSLYSSKVATAPWAQRYYSAPKRVWGFDQIFSNGTFPPITPKVISFRRAAFTTITSTTPAYQQNTTPTGATSAAANYNAQVNALWPGTNPSN